MQDKNKKERGLIFVVPDKKRPAAAFNAYASRAGFVFTKADPEEDRIPEGRMIDRTGELPTLTTRSYRCLDALRRLSLDTVDIVVVGRDTLEEFNAEARRGEYPRVTSSPVPLPVSKCTLQFIVPVGDPAGDKIVRPEDLEGRIIATSYPDTVKAWLAERGIKPRAIREFDGKIESHVKDGVADVGCDIVESGETMRKNGLRSTGILVEASSSLILRTDRNRGPENEAVIAQVISRLAKAARTLAP